MVTKDGQAIEASIGTVFRENGTYMITAVDDIGNTITYTFKIEKNIDTLVLIVGAGIGVTLVVLAAIIGFVHRKKKMSKV